MTHRTLLSGLLLGILLSSPLAAQGSRPGIRILNAPSNGELRMHALQAPAPESATTVLFGAETVAHTASGAISGNALAVRRVAAVLSDLGVAPSQVEIREVTVIPEYERAGVVSVRPTFGNPPRIIGYRAVRMIRVVVPDPDRLGLVIDSAAGAGANRVLAVQAEEELGMRW